MDEADEEGEDDCEISVVEEDNDVDDGDVASDKAPVAPAREVKDGGGEPVKKRANPPRIPLGVLSQSYMVSNSSTVVSESAAQSMSRQVLILIHPVVI